MDTQCVRHTIECAQLDRAHLFSIERGRIDVALFVLRRMDGVVVFDFIGPVGLVCCTHTVWSITVHHEFRTKTTNERH